MSDGTTIVIEAEGQPSVQIVLEAPPELVVADSGVQGQPGGPGPPGADLGGYDPGDLTLAFDNQLL